MKTGRLTLLPSTDARGPIFLAASFTLLVLTALIFFAHTPRSRLNVMQVAAAIFFLRLLTWQAQRNIPTAQGKLWPKSPAHGLWLGLAFATCLYSLHFPPCFLNDDFVHVYNVRQFNLYQLGQSMFIRQGWEPHFRPLGIAAFWLDYQLWQQQPAGYHFTNLLLHLAGIVGLFFFCESLGLERQTAASAALVFAVLPVQAEAVAWVGARFDLLATTLVIWSLVLYSRFRRSGRWAWYLGAMVTFSLAMLSKENAYVLPVLAVSLEVFIFRQRRVKPLVGFFLLASLSFAYRWVVLGGMGGYLAPTYLLQFGFKTLEGLFIRAPAQLLLGYNWLQSASGYILVTAALTAGLLLALSFGVKQQASRRGWVAFALAWIVLSVLPVHPLLLIGAGLTNSRFLYPAMSGVAILVSLLLAGVESPRLREIWILTLGVLLSLGLLHNLGAWRSTCLLSHRFLTELKRLEPAPPPNTEFIFRDMPYTIRGVYFFHVGLAEAMKLTYGRGDLSARRESEALPRLTIDANRRPLVKLHWKGANEALLQRVP